MAKETNAVEKPATKNAEPVIGQRFVKLRQREKHRIEFGVFVSRPDGKTVQVFGKGIFEAQDLYCLAIALTKLASDSVDLSFVFDETWEGDDA
jgi:hypothetical protein